MAALALAPNAESVYAFYTIKPLLCDIMKNPTEKNLYALKCQIRAYSSFVLDDLCEYILFPLQAHLKRSDHSEDVLTLICEILSALFHCVGKCEWNNFTNIFPQIFYILSSNQDHSELADRNERIRCNLLSLAKILLKILSDVDKFKLTTDEFMPVYGHAFYMLLKICEKERSIKVKMTAVDVINLLTTFECEEKHIDNVRLIADSIASFLPGICVSFSHILIENHLLSHKFAVKIINTWQHILFMCFADKFLVDDKLITNKCTSELKIVRSSSWYSNTLEKLAPLIEKVLKHLVMNVHNEIHRSLIQFISSLLTDCWLCFKECRTVFLESLITLTCNSWPETSAEAAIAIQKLINNDCERQIVFQNVINDSLHNLCLSLPRLVRSCNLNHQTITADLLCGIAKLISADAASIVTRSTHLMRRLLCAIAEVLEINVKRLQIVSTVDQTQFDSNIDTFTAQLRQPMHFQFVDFDTASKFLASAAIITKNGDFQAVLLCLIDLMREFYHYRPAFIMILNEIICFNGSQLDDCLTETIIDELVEHIAVIDADRSTLDTSDAIISDVNSPDIQSLLTMLILESFAKCGLVLQNRFQRHLLKVIYPVLNSVSSLQICVRQSALFTLHDLAVACADGSISTLFITNIDYLLHSVTLKLKHFLLYPRSPLVLATIIEFCDEGILLLVVHLVYEILQTLDQMYGQKCVVFLKVLLAVSKSVHRLFPNSMPINVDASEVAIEEFSDEQSSENCEENLMIEESKKTSNVPAHICLLVEILNRTKHLISADMFSVRLIVLDIIYFALQSLRSWEDHLLPMIHQNWSGVAARFKTTENALVTISAFKVVLLMAEISQSFVYRKVVDDVLPNMIEFLKQSINKSEKTGAVYRQSPTFKLQQTYLEDFVALNQYLKFSERDMVSFLKISLNYLNRLQPEKLQLLTILMLDNLITINDNQSFVLPLLKSLNKQELTDTMNYRLESLYKT